MGEEEKRGQAIDTLAGTRAHFITALGPQRGAALCMLSCGHGGGREYPRVQDTHKQRSPTEQTLSGLLPKPAGPAAYRVIERAGQVGSGQAGGWRSI